MTWKQIFDGFKRRWRLIVLTMAIGLLISVLTFEQSVSWVRLEMDFIVGQEPSSPQQLAETRQWEWRASEYVTVAVSDWSNGTVFAKDVSKVLVANAYPEMTPEEVADNMSTQGGHSRITLAVVHQTEEGVRDFAAAASSVLIEQSGREMPQLRGAPPPVIYPLDTPETAIVEPYIPSVGTQMALPTRLLYSLLAGFILATIIEYFDPTIRHKDIIEQRLKMPLLGEIPTA